jgi:hypothetical protein
MNIYSCDQTEIKDLLNLNFLKGVQLGRKTWSQKGKETKLRDKMREMCDKVGLPRDEQQVTWFPGPGRKFKKLKKLIESKATH